MSSADPRPSSSNEPDPIERSSAPAENLAALRRVFHPIWSFCAYLVLLELGDNFLQIPQWLNALLRFVLYCACSALALYRGRSLLRWNKPTLFVALFFSSLFFVFLTDVTRTIDFFNAVPLLGDGSRLREAVQSFAEILALCSFLAGSAFAAVETHRAKLGLNLELDKLHRLEVVLRRQLSFNDLINRILARFSSLVDAEVDDGIRTSLREIAEFIGAEAGFVVMISAPTNTWRMTHEYCAPGATSLWDQSQNVPLDTFGWTTKKLLAGEILAIHRLTDYPAEAALDRQRAETAGIKSALRLPLRGQGGQVHGCIGLQSILREVNWAAEDIQRLSIVGDAIAHALERRSAAEALRQSEKRYRLISENTGDVIWTLEIASERITYVSPSVQRLRGRRPEEVMSEPLDRALTPESYQLAKTRLAEGLAAFQAGDASMYLQPLPLDQLRQDGSIVHTEVVVSPLLDEHGQLTEILGVTRDITERRKAERELQQSNSLLLATLESTADGILVVDSQGKMVGSNQRFVQMWQIPAELRTTDDDEQVLHYAMKQLCDPDAFLRRVRELYAQPETESFDVLKFKDGRFVERYSRPQRIGDHPVGRVWSFRDITHRKRLEDQLRQAQKMEAVGHLAGGVAHDFNNILTVIQGRCSLLLADPTTAAESRESLEQIADAAQRAATLTRQLLLFSRRQVMQLKPLALNDVILDLLKMLRRLLGETITLEFVPQPSPPMIEADAGTMEQLLMNLSVNARDAMPEGGRLTISTESVAISAEAAGANPEARPGHFLCLTVSDTGCGMDDATLKHIFEPFFTTKGVGKGTGLGLATVYGIVKEHRGWIEVRSTVGQGTTFSLFLPAIRRDVAAPKAPLDHQAVRGGTETILLVEDEIAVKAMVRVCLQRQGYTILEAANGVEALALWQTHRETIDLLFTDMVMPEGMTGLALAQRLRVEKAALKVLISSGYSAEMASGGARVREGITYLAKPYVMATLATAVRECLDGG